MDYREEAMVLQYKLLALDIDGTLLDSDSKLRERTVQAVKAARKSGIKVCLVSGRRPISMQRLAVPLELNDPMVCFNGGCVADPLTLQTMYAVTIRRGLLDPILKAWHAAGIPAFAYRNTATAPDVYYDTYPKWHRQQAYIELEGQNVQKVDVLWRDTDWEPLRVFVGACQDVGNKAAELAEPLVDRSHLRVLYTQNYDGTWYYELYPINATKSNGLRFLGKHFGIEQHEIVAVGDHINDLDMIEYAGLGVAMGNAQPEVKAKADMIIGHHDEDGLAVFIEQFLLKK